MPAKKKIVCMKTASPQFGQPEDCKETATHKVPGYFLKRQPGTGFDLYYCEKHAKEWDRRNFMGSAGANAEPLAGVR